MAFPKLAALNNLIPVLEKASQPGSSFAQILAQKKASIAPLNISSSLVPPASTSRSLSINKLFDHILSNHESVNAAMQSSVVKKRYSPEELLEKQFEIGTLLLREQMYAKTAESLTNSLKNFTQMQV